MRAWASRFDSTVRKTTFLPEAAASASAMGSRPS